MFFYVVGMEVTSEIQESGERIKRPAIAEGPNGAPFVGHPDLNTRTYLIAVPKPMQGLLPLTEDEVRHQCEWRGLNIGIALSWNMPEWDGPPGVQQLDA